MKPVLPPFQRGGGFGTLGTSFLEPSLPAPISLSPATWGAWSTLALALLGVVWLATYLLRRHKRSRHRLLARRELSALRSQWCAGAAQARPELLERLPRVLKGCALHSFERRRVAPLSGAAWLAFLRDTAPGAGFEGETGEALVTLSERGAPFVADAAVPALFNAAESWVRRHRA
jgi:hypothetical protein